MSRKIIESIQLSCVNPDKNQNKFYNLVLFDNNIVNVYYGRIGNKPKIIVKDFNQITGTANNYFHSQIEKKLKKGYQILKRVTKNPSSVEKQAKPDLKVLSSSKDRKIKRNTLVF